MTRVHAFGDDALGDDDAVDLADRVSRREVSPEELRAAVASRLDQVDPVLRGLGDDHREDPVLGDTAGPLAGVPTLIKENVDVAGWPTRNGSQAYRPSPSSRHGAVAEQVLASGLDLVGTTRMPEFGLNATTEFVDDEPTRNPWDGDHSSGGSSGGAAALVAAGVLPLAHGNDGGGSIRVPAAACGLIGLKPSRGRTAVSANGRRMPIDIQSDAVLSRSVRDTATFLAGVDRYRPDPSLTPLGLVRGPAPRRLRIGVAVELPPGAGVDAPVDPVTKQALESTARLLEGLGHDVLPSALGFDAQFVADFLDYWSVLALGVGAGGRMLFGSSFRFADLDPFTRTLARRGGRRLPQVPKVLRRLRRAGDRYRSLFARFDVLLTPVVGHPAPRLGWLGPSGDTLEVVDRLVRYVAYTPIANIAGTPSISLPAARTAGGVPVGVQLCGARGDERTLLELAYALELVSGWSGIR